MHISRVWTPRLGSRPGEGSSWWRYVLPVNILFIFTALFWWSSSSFDYVWCFQNQNLSKTLHQDASYYSPSSPLVCYLLVKGWVWDGFDSTLFSLDYLIHGSSGWGRVSGIYSSMVGLKSPTLVRFYVTKKKLFPFWPFPYCLIKVGASKSFCLEVVPILVYYSWFQLLISLEFPWLFTSLTVIGFLQQMTPGFHFSSIMIGIS